MANESASALNDGMIRRPAHLAEAFHAARGYVRGGRIQHRVVVSEGNVIQKLQIVFVIKRAPSAVGVLHADEPCQPAAHGIAQAIRVRIVDAAQGHQNEGGVVNVGVKIIAELKCPAARLRILILNLPVAGSQDLVGNHPTLGSNEGGMRGIDAGFNAVMLCDSDIEVTARLADAAHARGVAVEAELGHLPDGGADGRVDPSHAILTDPDEAATFVAATGIDSLAVSIGNVHTLEGAQATIDLDRLAAVRAQVAVPLVAHGGTAFPATAVPGAIERGVAKFNVGTVLKRTYLQSLRNALVSVDEAASPHDLIGSHSEHDLLEAGKADVTAVVRGLISRYGGSGRA